MMWGLNDVLTYSIAYGMGEEEGRAKAEREKKASSNWHTGTPTEIKGWFLFKYRAYGKFVYRAVENPVVDIFADSELEWQKIEED